MKLFLSDLERPYTAALFDAHTATGILLTGTQGDADLRHLIQGAITALHHALEALEGTQGTQGTEAI